MKPMFLPAVENHEPTGHHGAAIHGLRAAGQAVPQILHLFAFKPEQTRFLELFSQGVMRGPSPLSPGFRELIAAYTSKLNHCPF